MSKINKELEALQQVKATICIKGGISGNELSYIDIIESAIKKAYRMNIINNMLCEVVLDNKENVSQKQLIYLCTEMRKIMNEE